ncbi:CP2 transcription factor [Penicillium hetheringtonii]|uniref:CP2 transcription factor n=1 Tax=Penicillium hetheringtonii TaxID=911720 RepID=A0AAD6DDI2_9EURO|nr:CP2 transcription factor [Penicillium hetheringtonii]
MFCHRKSSFKPDSALIGRFQSLYDKTMIGRPADSHDAKIQSSEGQDGVTPSLGANKKVKGNAGGANDFFSFDGCVPTENFQSLITEQWLTPRGHDTSQIPLQFKNTTMQDAIDLQSQNIPQALSRTNDTGSMMDLEFGDQLGGQVDSNFQKGVNPSHLWMGLDPVAPQNVLTPNEFVNQGAYPDTWDLLRSPLIWLNHRTVNDRGMTEEWASKTTFSHVRNLNSKFRYHTILRASTAMINNSEDSPVSYLNKGQVYHLTVEDTNSTKVDSGSYQYQTFIRISFGEDQQRSDPAVFWQLWRSGRASNEFQKNGQPKAVEYAGQNNSLMQLENESLDGFSVTWTKNPVEGIARCSIPIRFNFLSTDFTLSKGVKGMQVRLCAKTKQLWDTSPEKNETSFCNVKLFRDHGAERKLSNDAVSLRKKMEKLKLQLKEPPPPEPMSKRKRGSNQIQRKLEAMQISAQSCLPENPLVLRAAEKDDPELHPTQYLHPSLEKMDGNDYRRSSSSGKSSYQNSDSMEKEMPSSSTATSNVGEAFDDALSTISFNSERSTGPAACFYIKLCKNDEPTNEYYRAIYPRGRTVHDLKSALSHKILPDPADIAQILYINPAGLKVVVDDEFVQEIAEGQSMILRIIDIPSEAISNGGKYEIRLEY